MSIPYHKVISGYKYTEYNITTLTQYNVYINTNRVTELFFILYAESIPNNL